MRKVYLHFTIVCSIFISSLYSGEISDNISVKSAVIFNTLCAKCHEGQCSGRLTFDTGSEAASNHIKRYSADVNISKDEIKEFFTLLNYMKKDCLLFMPKGIKYKKENLLSFSTLSHKRYFIPLGRLKKGEYLISLHIKENIHYSMEIISSQFDSYFSQTICPDAKKKVYEFSVDEDTNFFLRIQSKEPLNLEKLDIYQ